MRRPLFFFLLLLPLELWAGKYSRFEVMFKEDVSNEAKDELHRRTGTNLNYRAKNFRVDLVQIKPLSRSSDSCKAYLESGLVSYCEPAAMMTPPSGSSACTNISQLSSATQFSFSSDGCNLFPEHNLAPVEGLHPLWSQMRIGSDLVREEVEQLRAEGQVFPPVNVGNIDGGFNPAHSDMRTVPGFSPIESGVDPDHGTKVVNLIAGRGNHGASATAQISFLANAYDEEGQLITALDNALNEDPEILNLEIHTLCAVRSDCEEGVFYGSGVITRELIKMASQQMIVVAAAGNMYPRGSGKAGAIGEPSLIVVGSADLMG